MAPRKLPIERAELIAIRVFEDSLPIFLRNRRMHPNHDRETCFQETIEELRAVYAAEETDTRRSSGS